MINKYEKGCLTMINIDSDFKSLETSWMSNVKIDKY